MSAASLSLRSFISLILPAGLFVGLPGTSLGATYYVDAKAGDDGASPSTATNAETPWASLTRALGEDSLTPGDIIRIAPGTYSAAGGEAFPLDLVDGVSLIGASSGEVVVSGVGIMGLEALFRGGDGFEFVHLEGMGLGGATNGVSLNGMAGAASLTLIDLSFEELQAGAAIDLGADVDTLTLTAQGNSGVDLFPMLSVNTSGNPELAIDATLEDNIVTGGSGVTFGVNGNTGPYTLTLNSDGNVFNGADSAFNVISMAPSEDLNLLGFLVGDTYNGPTGPQVNVLIQGGDGSSDITMTTLLDIVDSSFVDLDAMAISYDLKSPNIDVLNQILTIDGNGFSGNGPGVLHHIHDLDGATLTPQLIVTDNDFTGGITGVDIRYDTLTGGALDGLASISGNTFVDMSNIGVQTTLENLTGLGAALQTTDIDGNVFMGTGESPVFTLLSNVNDSALVSFEGNATGNTIDDVSGDGAIHLEVSDLTDIDDLSIQNESGGNTFTNLEAVAIYDSRNDVYGNGNVYMGHGSSENNLSDGADSLLDIRWGGMPNNVDLEAVVKAIDNNAEGVRDSVIRIAQSGMDGNLSIRGQTAVAGNQLLGGDVGAYIDLQGLQDAVVSLVDIDVVNNAFESQDSYAAQLSVYSIGNIDDGRVNTLVAGNEITQPGSIGVLFNANSFDTNAVDHQLTIGGNEITEATEDGISISTEGLTLFNTADVRIEDNVVQGSGRDGFNLQHGDPPTSTFASISGNQIENNIRYGVFLRGSSFDVDDLVPPWDLGGGALSSSGQNSFLGNGEYAIVSDSPHSEDIGAQSNYWGTTNFQEIELAVYDDRDTLDTEGDIAQVSILAPLEEAPGLPAVNGVITSELIEDDGLVGPSPGDVVRYTATLTGTGDVGCRSGILNVPAPIGGAFVKDANSASLGVVAYADVRGLKAYLGYIPTGRSITVTWDVDIFDGGTCEGIGAIDAIASCEAIPELAISGGALALTTQTFGRDSDGDGYGDPNDTQTSCYPDEVFEGYVLDTQDCDDTNADISPDAQEACDEVDNDCDTFTDEGAAEGSMAFPIDVDEDGYGDSAAGESELACNPPAGYGALDGDCDDGDPDINPGADELCDEVDQDCDSAVDEGVLSTFYLDADGDGVGDDGESEESCEAPDGYVEAAGDCDDDDDTIYPGADEVCDEADQDCDEAVDEGVGVQSYPDNDGDGYGTTVGAELQCPGTPGFAEEGGDCDDRAPLTYPGADEICDDEDNDCDRDTDEGLEETYYEDADDDSYGDPEVSQTTCAPPGGYVTNDDDCNDNSDVSFPGAEEVCDLDDNDCDGDTDEGVTTTYYIDADDDGQGSDDGSTEACEVPAGYATGSEDCDDSNPAIYVGAEEICDGADNNCDGEVDEGDICPESPTPIDIDVEGGGGCSCDSTQDPGRAGGLALLFLGLIAYRRRAAP